MILDSQLLLSSSQAVTAAAASTNYIDQGAARDIGIKGTPAALVVTCNTTCTAAGAATVQFQLQCATDAAFTTPINVIETDAIPKASLVAGYQLILQLPPGLNKEFVRLYYNVGTGPLTAGAFSAAIVADIQSSVAYHSATQN